MKQFSSFLKKSLLFILGFIVIVYILDETIKYTICTIKVGDYGVLNKINNGEINTDIIISGSSRALKAINSRVITEKTGMSCFNIASVGSGLGVQLPKFKWYLNNNKKPKILVQDLSQFGGEISRTIYEPYKYIAYLSDDSLYQGILKIDKNFWKSKYIAPYNLVYYNFDFYSKLGIELIQTFRKQERYINGFFPDNSKWSSNFETFKQKNPDGINCSITNSYKKYIYELIKFCKKENIVLVITILPNYYKLKEIAQNIDDVNAFYKSLKEEPKVYFFDYSSSAISKNEKYLYNFTHLNLDGANHFTELFANQLLEINLNKNE